MTVLDAFPVTQGHVMLMPRVHTTASSEIQDQIRLTQDAIRVFGFLRSLYPGIPLISFEHGSGYTHGKKILMCGSYCSAGNDHTHIHFLPAIHPESHEPSDLNIQDLTDEVKFLLKIGGWEDLESTTITSQSGEVFGSRDPEFVGESPYIWFGILDANNQYKEKTFVQREKEQSVPSQALRRSIVKLLLGRLPPSTTWDYHELGWRIFVDGFQSDIPGLRKHVEAFQEKMGNLR